MNFRKLFIFIFISAKAHPFAKLWDEFEQWPGLGFRGISTFVKIFGFIARNKFRNPSKEKFERRSFERKMNQNYPINFLDRTATVSMKDLFEQEFSG